MFFPPYRTFTLATSHRITMLIFVLTAALELYVIRCLDLATHELSESRERSHTLSASCSIGSRTISSSYPHCCGRDGKKLGGDSAGADALDAARARLDMMSRVHRSLHDLSSVDLSIGDYLKGLCANLIKASDTPQVRLIVRADPVALDLEELMSVSLIVADLVTNSLKHAFKGRSDGDSRVDFAFEKGSYILVVADDGPGMPAKAGTSKSSSLGQGILQSLARHLHGQFILSMAWHNRQARIPYLAGGPSGRSKPSGRSDHVSRGAQPMTNSSD